ncbi:MAG: hypothetical protein HEQ32_07015 [Vampirovibrio sp.]
MNTSYTGAPLNPMTRPLARPLPVGFPTVKKAPPPAEPSINWDNVALGVAGLVGVGILGTMCYKRDWKIWENTLSTQLDELKHLNPLKQRVAQLEQNVPTPHVNSTTRAATRPQAPSRHELDAFPDDELEGTFWNPLLGRLNIFRSDPSANVQPDDYLGELINVGFDYSHRRQVYTYKGAFNNPDIEAIRTAVSVASRRRKDVDADRILENKPHIHLSEGRSGLLGQEKYFLATNTDTNIQYYIPHIDLNRIPPSTVSTWVKDGLFLLPPNETLQSLSRSGVRNFKVQTGGLPQKVFIDGEAHVLPGFLVPN